MKGKWVQRNSLIVALFLSVWVLMACRLTAPRPAATTQTPIAPPRHTAAPTGTRPSMTPALPTSSPSPTVSPTPAQAPLWASEGLPQSPGLSSPAMAVDHQGNLHMVWANDEWNGDKDTLHILYARKMPEGAWPDPMEIRTLDRTNPWFGTLDLAVDSHDVPHVIWTEDRAVFYASLDVSGGWSLPTEIAPTVCPDRCQLSSAMAIDAADTLHLIWMAEDRILWSSKPRDGDWSSAVPLSAETAYASQPSIAVDSRGGLHVVWLQDQLWHVFKAAGQPWSQPVVISGPAQHIWTCSLAVDSADVAHVVWLDSSRSEQRAEFLHTYASSGGDWSPPAAIPAHALSGNTMALAAVGAGNLILIWGDQQVRYATKLAGQPWSAPASIPNSSPFALAVMGDQAGYVHVTWADSGLQYAREPFTRIALPATAQAGYTPPPGMDEFAVRTGPGERQEPDIGNNMVVWSEKGEKDWDILGFDLASQSALTITDHEGDQLYPAIDANTVVWEDHLAEVKRAGVPRIYGLDLETRQEFLVTAESSPQWRPDISGEMVVFRDWRKTGQCGWGGSAEFGTSLSCDWDIWGADLARHAEFPVRTEPKVQGLPRISGNTVVWSEEADDSGSTLYAYRLGGADNPIRIASSTNSSFLSPALDGNVVVWSDWRNGVQGIFGYQLSTGSEFLIAVGQVDNPAISGNLVVWVDKRNGDADIYGFNLATGQEFAICTAPGDQENPAIDGNVVVWVDKRNFSVEIYGVRLPSLNGEQTERILSAPTPTPTSTPMPTPTPAPTPVLSAPILLLPPNNSALDTLIPVFRYDLNTGDTKIESYSYRIEPVGGGDPVMLECSLSSGPPSESSLHECIPVNNLQQGKTYAWSISYFTGSAWADSGTWSFTTPTHIAFPPAPDLVTPADGSQVGLEDLCFKWAAVDNAVQYQTHIKTWSETGKDWFEFVSWWADDVPGDCGNTSNCQRGVSYMWGVRARTEHAWSEWAEATFTVSP